MFYKSTILHNEKSKILVFFFGFLFKGSMHNFFWPRVIGFMIFNKYPYIFTQLTVHTKNKFIWRFQKMEKSNTTYGKILWDVAREIRKKSAFLWVGPLIVGGKGKIYKKNMNRQESKNCIVFHHLSVLNLKQYIKKVYIHISTACFK